MSAAEILHAVSAVATAAARPHVDRRRNRLPVERSDDIVRRSVFSIGTRVVHRRGEDGAATTFMAGHDTAVKIC